MTYVSKKSSSELLGEKGKICRTSTQVRETDGQYLQQENKSMLTFAALLVELGVFRKV